jgi:hypothetical protein
MADFLGHVQRVGDPFEYNFQVDLDQVNEVEEMDDQFGPELPRRTILDRSNPLESIRDNEFR